MEGVACASLKLEVASSAVTASAAPGTSAWDIKDSGLRVLVVFCVFVVVIVFFFKKLSLVLFTEIINYNPLEWECEQLEIDPEENREALFVFGFLRVYHQGHDGC